MSRDYVSLHSVYVGPDSHVIPPVFLNLPGDNGRSQPDFHDRFPCSLFLTRRIQQFITSLLKTHLQDGPTFTPTQSQLGTHFLGCFATPYGCSVMIVPFRPLSPTPEVLQHD